MYKEFVSHDIALTLKELGFDEPCFGVFQTQENNRLVIQYFQKSSLKVAIHLLPAPTFSQAFRWFREKYGLMHIINPYDFTAEIDSLKERIVDEKYGDFIPHHHIIDDEGEEIKHSSYEEAEVACLDKLIEIVKDGKYKKT